MPNINELSNHTIYFKINKVLTKILLAKNIHSYLYETFDIFY
jgi:hypothetical protein